jgi:hypothetical protein
MLASIVEFLFSADAYRPGALRSVAFIRILLPDWDLRNKGSALQPADRIHRGESGRRALLASDVYSERYRVFPRVLQLSASS